MTDGSQKVRAAHGVQCRDQCVSIVEPHGSDEEVFELSMPQRLPTSAPDSMKANSTERGEASTSFIHLQAPRSPFGPAICVGKTNLA